MSSIEIRRVDYKKHGTSSFAIKGAAFSLKNCEILEITDSKYDYQKVVVKLSEEKINKMNMFEEEVNDYLDEIGIDKIKLVYGNKVYAKKCFSTPKKHLNYIKLKGVFINNESKPFVQLWVI